MVSRGVLMEKRVLLVEDESSLARSVITPESAPGQASQFVVRLPRAPAPEGTAAPVSYQTV